MCLRLKKSGKNWKIINKVEGTAMDYKKAITGMINEIQSEKILRYICIIVADIYNDLRR